MLQNHFGLKIAELRTQLGLTQEELAAKCNINVRTIQRIEKGEVKPRAYTLKILSTALGYDLLNIETKSFDNLKAWIIGFYASSLVAVVIPWGLFVAVAVVAYFWQQYKNESDSIYEHGKNVINFQIVMIVFGIILFVILLLVFTASRAGIQEFSIGIISFTNYYLIAYYILVGTIAFYSITNILLYLTDRKPMILVPSFIK